MVATLQSSASFNDSYTDLAGLNSIKVAGREDSKEGLKQVAKQFEGLFLNMVIKSMRKGNQAFSQGSYLNGKEMEFYQQNFDNQMSVHLSAGKGIGLADVLYKQMLRQYQPSEDAAVANQFPDRYVRPMPRTYQLQQTRAVQHPGVQHPGAKHPGAKHPGVKHPGVQHRAVQQTADPQELFSNNEFTSPEQFVRSLYPYAKVAAQKIGVRPELLLAQSALETGWGKKITQGQQGNSYNLFGIKADTAWQGDSSMASTLEFSEGVAVREKHRFRHYQSYAESFDDYVNFIQTNPRYSPAINRSANSEGFVEELHRAGYATDPAYAEKVNGVLQSPLMVDAIAGLNTNTRK